MKLKQFPKIFYLGWCVVKRQLFNKKFSALIDVTNECNLKCKHCYNRGKYLSKKIISLEEWKGRFNEYRKIGIRSVGLVGGEPTLRMDVIRLAEKYFPFVLTYTNGQIRIPKDINCRIALSLDGLEREHDSVRGGGTFKKAILNYKGDERVFVFCVLSKLNYKGVKKMEEFFDFIRKMNWNLWLDFFVPQINIKKDYNLILSKKEIKAIEDLMIKELNRRDCILNYTSKKVINFFKQDLSGKECGLRKENYIFSADGNLKHCVSETADCSRCRARTRYYTPFYNLFEWFSYKILMKNCRII